MSIEQKKDDGQGNPNDAGASLRLGQLEADNAELQRRLHAESVEQGRLRKMSETIKEKDAEIARLTAELATKGSGAVETPASLRELLGEDTALAVASLAAQEVQRRVAPVQEELSRRTAADNAREAQDAVQREKMLLARVEARFPGLVGLTNDGGENQAAWDRFVRQRPNIRNVWAYAAQTGNDTELTEYLLRFYDELGVSPPEGGNAQPTPRMSTGGSDGHGVRQQKTVTASEVKSVMDRARDDLGNGVITLEQYKAIKSGVDAAYDEGRVVPG